MTDVFISYSRLDKDFVGQLRESLLTRAQDVWIDWEDIPPSQAWWDEIKKGITRANNFVLVLSPNSMASPICQMEVEYARQLKKRIIPVLYADFDREECLVSITKRLAKKEEMTTREIWGTRQPYDVFDANDGELKHINYFFFKADSDFATRFDELFTVIRTDYEHKEQHTTLQLRALEWDRRGRDASFLLLDTELEQARAWLGASPGKEPAPTELQRNYIQASEKRTRQLRNIRRISVIGSLAAVLALVFAIGASLVGLNASNSANQAQTREAAANTQAAVIATQVKDGENRTQSLLLASKADALFRDPSSPNLPGMMMLLQAVSLDPANEAARSVMTSALLSSDPYDTQRLPHSALVWSAVYSPDSRYILTGSNDGNVRLWDAASGQLIRSYPTTPGSGVIGVAYAPDGRHVAGASSDGKVYLWDIASDEQPMTFPHDGPANTVAFSPDGRYLVSTSDDWTARVWDVETGQERSRLEHDGIVRSAVFSSDGRWVLTGDYGYYDVPGATLWDWRNNEKRLDIPHPDRIYVVAISPDGNYAVTGSRDGQARLWDLNTGELVRIVANHRGGVVGVAFSPDGRTILTGGNDYYTRLWDTSTGALLHTYKGYGSGINSVAFSPDGRFIVTGNSSPDNAAHIWPLQPLIRTLQGHTGTVYVITFSPSGRYLLTAGADGTVRLWDATTYALIRTFAAGLPVTGADFSPDERYLASASGSTAWVWEVENGTLVRSFPSLATQYDSPGVVDVAFSPDGRYLVASQYDSTVCRWQLATDDGTQPCMAWTHNPYHPEVGLHPIVISPDSRFLVSTNPLSKQQPFTTLDVWSVETVGDTVTPIEQMTGGVLPILGVAFSPTGRYLASAGSDGFVRVFDTRTWHVAQTLGGGLGGGFFHPAFSSDEHNLLAGSSDGTAKLWDLSTGALLRTFYGHTRYVADAVFSPDGHWVLTASADGTVIVQPLEFQEVVNAVCAQLSHRQFSTDEFALYGLSDTMLACPPSNNAIVPTLPPISTQLLPVFTPLVPHPIYQILPTEIPIPTLSPIMLTVNAPATPPIPDWTPLPSPTASYTPTLTSTPVVARAGEQRGEIQLGSAQVWMYAGQAGEAVTIRVNADLPAVNDQVQNESGLDTYVTIYSPDGNILADNDDRSSDPHYTDSFIESVTLPADGLYQIVVSDLLNANAGRYILVIESSHSGKPAPSSTPTPAAAP